MKLNSNRNDRKRAFCVFSINIIKDFLILTTLSNIICTLKQIVLRKSVILILVFESLKLYRLCFLNKIFIL